MPAIPGLGPEPKGSLATQSSQHGEGHCQEKETNDEDIPMSTSILLNIAKNTPSSPPSTHM